MKTFLVPGVIAISLGLFAFFIFGIQRHINPRPHGISYSMGLRQDGDRVWVVGYKQPDVLPTKKDSTPNSGTQNPAATTGGKNESKPSDEPEDSSRTEKENAKNPSTVVTTPAISLKESQPIAIDSVAYGPRMIAINKNPKLGLLILTFSLMVSASFTLGAGFVNQIITMSRTFKITTGQWFGNGALALAFFVALCYTNMNSNGERTFLPPLDIVSDLNAIFNNGVFWWIYTGEGIAFLVGSIAFFGVLVLHAILQNKAKKVINIAHAVVSDKLDKATYQLLKADLDRYLAGISVLVVFSVLTISFLNQALIMHFINIEAIQVIRTEFIYAYGFMFSSLLALIYIPTNQRLFLAAEPGSFDEAGKEKNMFFNNFTSLISILAPLLGSAVTEMITAFSQ